MISDPVHLGTFLFHILGIFRRHQQVRSNLYCTVRNSFCPEKHMMFLLCMGCSSFDLAMSELIQEHIRYMVTLHFSRIGLSGMTFDIECSHHDAH